MRIAYLILCHTDPKHIGRLARKITMNTENKAFIHVDAKQEIKPYLDELSNVKTVSFLTKRIKINWGGWSSVKATIELLREALKDGPFERFILLQGLEYPIKSNEEIADFLEKNIDKEFIKAQNISYTTNYKESHKYRLYWCLDNNASFLTKIIHKLNHELFLRTKWIPNFKKNYVLDITGRKMDIYQGCAQFGITREAAEYIVKFHDNNLRVNQYFQSVFAPDESYFHTIIYNSEFIKKTQDGRAVTRENLTDYKNLTYFEYPIYVTLFKKKEDWPKLRDSGYLFFRKASSESKELLDYIDMIHEQ